MDFTHWYYKSDGTVRDKWIDEDTEDTEDTENYVYNDMYIEFIKGDKDNE